jgi:hypothetical protein
VATSTTINGFPKPELSDVPNIETAVGNFADAVDSRVIPIFATTGARDTAISAPSFGMHAAVSGTGEVYYYNGTAWVSAVPRTIYKTSNETVTSSTTLQNDNDFFLNVEANSLYIVDLTLALTGNSGGDFRSLWTYPSGATGTRHRIALQHGGTVPDDLKAPVSSIADTNQDTGTLGTDLTEQSIFKEWLTFDTAGTSGTLQFTWCQRVSSGTATTVRAGSVMQVWKVG